MKVTLSRSPKEPEITYPCLMESTITPGRVILFTEQGKGTVIAEPDGVYNLGYAASMWDMNFKPYQGAVILEN